MSDHALIYQEGEPYCACDLRKKFDTGEDVLVHVLDARDAEIARLKAELDSGVGVTFALRKAADAEAGRDRYKQALVKSTDALIIVSEQRDRLRAAIDEALAIVPPWTGNTVYRFRGIFSAALTESEPS